ncbi:MAG: hypothetical protein JO195_00915, partial [Candidatus Eremiobacteraeota bacterium]|nr:hypothetical protein [Candidatus Eremiobacteraeota bacterium]
MSTVGILAAREYMSRLRSRGFIIGTILGIGGIVALSFISAIGSWLAGTFTTSIALVGPDPSLTRAIARDLRDDYAVTVIPVSSDGPHLPTAVKR